MENYKLTGNELNQMAHNIRRDVLRMTAKAGPNGGHIGGSFSSAEIFAVLYGSILNNDPSMTDCDDRDRFFLSKGHCAIGHYAALKEAGYITNEDLDVFEVSGSSFPTHEVINQNHGIEISSGSLGYGLSIGVGSALAAKRAKKSYQVYVLLGDGECNEGSVWEAAMAAAQFKLDNLTAIIDLNGQSLDGMTAEIMPVKDMASAWKSFGWHVSEVDGHDVDRLMEAFHHRCSDKPHVVIAHTIKGKGLASIEGKTGWHHTRLTEEQYLQLSKELENTL